MLYTLLDSPCMLCETFELLNKYMNELKYVEIAQKLCRRFDGLLSVQEKERVLADAQTLESISDYVCKGLSLADEDMGFFMRNFKTKFQNHQNCVAKVMLYSVFALTECGFYEQVEASRRRWEYICKRGYKILEFTSAGMYLCESDYSFNHSLFDQIYELIYPIEAKVDSYRALSNYNSQLDILVALMEPYYKRLLERMDDIMPIYRRIGRFWSDYLDKCSYEEFLEIYPTIESIDNEYDENVQTHVNIGVFSYNTLSIGFGPNLNGGNINNIYIGLSLHPGFGSFDAKADSKKLVNIVKTLADEPRLTLLQRLETSSSYCLELANETGQNSGNISRNLNLLFDAGLLIKERKNARTYYRTNSDAILNVFRSIENYLGIKRD